MISTTHNHFYLQDEYSQALQVIESCILATDLEQHFRHRDRITKFASGCSLSPRSQEQSSIQEEQFLLQSALMTAADLGAVTKPWAVHRHVSQLIAEEFWKQGYYLICFKSCVISTQYLYLQY